MLLFRWLNYRSGFLSCFVLYTFFVRCPILPKGTVPFGGRPSTNDSILRIRSPVDRDECSVAELDISWLEHTITTTKEHQPLRIIPLEREQEEDFSVFICIGLTGEADKVELI